MFNFRVSWRSMLALAAWSILVVALVFSQKSSVLECFERMLVHFERSTIFTILFFERSLEYLLFTYVPFRGHIRENPSVFLTTLGVSYIATAAMFVAFAGLSELETLYALGLVLMQHFLAYGFWVYLIYDGSPGKARTEV